MITTYGIAVPRIGVGVSSGVLQQVLQVRAQQLFGIRHGVVAVATVHRIPGTCDERRVQCGGEMGRHQPAG